MKTINVLKKFVSSFTTTFVILQVLATVYAAAQIFALVGLVGGWSDQLFTDERFAIYWVVLSVSRVGFTYSLIWLNVSITALLKKHDWYWFKPERSYYHEEESKDYSWMVLYGIVLLIIGILGGELILRIATWSLPPFYTGE